LVAHADALTLRRFAQYFFIRADTSARSSGGIGTSERQHHSKAGEWKNATTCQPTITITLKEKFVYADWAGGRFSTSRCGDITSGGGTARIF
jgi:hypothetical protein